LAKNSAAVAATSLYLALLCAASAAQPATDDTAIDSTVTVTAAALPEEATAQKTTTPGGLTIVNSDDAKLGRSSNFEDLLQLTPGLVIQTENGMEASKVSIRGSGIESEDEPVGVMVLLDGLNYNQGDGEVLLEDLNLDAIRYAEVFRGAAALEYGSIALGGAIGWWQLRIFSSQRIERDGA
jgi:iron complex outermembrane receptor protein